jgi:hypothetical protein
MAFSRERAHTPVSIADVTVNLYSPDPAEGGTSRAEYSVQVRYSDGSINLVAGNLAPHLSNAQINGLLSFMTDMRAKAVAEILP